MTLDELRRLVEERAVVRVWDGPHSSVCAQGRVVALIEVPALIIDGDDGERHHVSSALPIEVMTWQDERGEVTRERWLEP